MYDAPTRQWVMRQTGIMVAVPEIWGHIFVGRTKEGFSLNKVMIGYGGLDHGTDADERRDDADPRRRHQVARLRRRRRHVIWNLGFYGDAMSEGQTFSTYENQVAGRVAWLPMLSPRRRTISSTWA